MGPHNALCSLHAKLTPFRQTRVAIVNPGERACGGDFHRVLHKPQCLGRNLLFELPEFLVEDPSGWRLQRDNLPPAGSPAVVPGRLQFFSSILLFYYFFNIE